MSNGCKKELINLLLWLYLHIICDFCPLDIHVYSICYLLCYCEKGKCNVVYTKI